MLMPVLPVLSIHPIHTIHLLHVRVIMNLHGCSTQENQPLSTQSDLEGKIIERKETYSMETQTNYYAAPSCKHKTLLHAVLSSIVPAVQEHDADSSVCRQHAASLSMLSWRHLFRDMCAGRRRSECRNPLRGQDGLHVVTGRYLGLGLRRPVRKAWLTLFVEVEVKGMTLTKLTKTLSPALMSTLRPPSSTVALQAASR